ncbi:MAG: hypothetical protein MUF69_03105 [Desulfobacterota bacterium]|jgi:plasmid stability protein|nr:hypothetical protein [Thermodesulfobacteriota bacterium]
MRLTANMPDRVFQELKVQASLEQKSVSSLVTEIIEFGLRNKKKRKAKADLLKMIGKINLDPKTLKMLEDLRAEDDRA